MSDKKLKETLIFTVDVTDLDKDARTDLTHAIERVTTRFKLDLHVKKWKESPVRLCENCGRDESVGIHWDDLDGPNRAGWGCSRGDPRHRYG